LRRCNKRELIRDKIKLLARDPLALSANVKALSGREDYRLRLQDWRVIFEFRDGVLEIKEVVPRGGACRE
jgi:mRNA interferase RelE/StbE